MTWPVAIMVVGVMNSGCKNTEFHNHLPLATEQEADARANETPTAMEP